MSIIECYPLSSATVEHIKTKLQIKYRKKNVMNVILGDCNAKWGNGSVDEIVGHSDYEHIFQITAENTTYMQVTIRQTRTSYKNLCVYK